MVVRWIMISSYLNCMGAWLHEIVDLYEIMRALKHDIIFFFFIYIIFFCFVLHKPIWIIFFSFSWSIYLLLFQERNIVLEVKFQGVKKQFTMLQVSNLFSDHFFTFYYQCAKNLPYSSNSLFIFKYHRHGWCVLLYLSLQILLQIHHFCLGRYSW
jgi:hypothetical protein